MTSALQSRVCGLCGNYNRNPQDDWIIGPKYSPTGNTVFVPYFEKKDMIRFFQTDMLDVFGDSWRNDDIVDADAACWSAICLPTLNEKPCPPDVLTKGALICQQRRKMFEVPYNTGSTRF